MKAGDETAGCQGPCTNYLTRESGYAAATTRD